MRIKKTSFASFSTIGVDRHTPRSKFFNEIDLIIDWVQVDKLRNTYYSKGSSAVEQDAYSGWLLFKILLVGAWYGLSDEKTEEMIKDSLSAIKLCGLRLEDDVPHSTWSRFITKLPQAQALDTILNHINKHLQSKGFIAKGAKLKAKRLMPWHRTEKKTSETQRTFKQKSNKQRPYKLISLVLTVKPDGLRKEGICTMVIKRI